MNKLKTILVTVVITILFVLVGYLVSRQIPKPLGNTPNGSVAISGSSSLVTLPSHASLQIFASSTCVSRLISHASTSIRFTTEDSATNPSGTNGHFHQGTTSVSYDSGIYGCGLWRAYNPSGTQVTFTISEYLGFR